MHRIVHPLSFLLFLTCCQTVARGQGNSPFDQLDDAVIPIEERIIGQPKELVAMLGSNRGRHWGALTYLVHSPDGKHLVCSDNRGVIGIWDSRTLRQVAEFQAHSWHIYNLAFSRDGKVLASASTIADRKRGFPGEVKLWDFPTRKLRATIETGELSEVIALCFSPDGQRLAGANGAFHDEGKIPFVWDLSKDPPKLVPELKGHKHNVRSTVFTPDGKSLLTGDLGGQLHLWDAATGEPRRQWDVPGGALVGLTFTQDGKLLSSSRDEIIRVWDWQSGKLTERSQLKCAKAKLEPGLSALFAKANLEFMAVSRDSTRLASVDDRAEIRLWDLTASPPKQLAVLERLSKRFPGTLYYHKAAFSPDGKTLSAIGG